MPSAIVEQREKHGFAAPLELFLDGSADYFRGPVMDWFEGVPFLDTKACRAAVLAYFRRERFVGLEEMWRVVVAAAWYQMFFTHAIAPPVHAGLRA